MANSIQDFISNFQGGLRPNRFRVIGAIGEDGDTTDFHIISASLPASKISTIEVPYRGRIYKIPGNREYSEWEITILDDTASGTVLWKDFHDWSENFNSHVANTLAGGIAPGFGAGSNASADGAGMNDWTVEQLDLNGVAVKKVTLINCWPSKVGAVSLSMDKNEELVSFPVTIQYQYIEIDGLTE
jgi:hypothetical protein